MFIGVFINAESLRSCVPCGRFFHSAEAPFHQPPQHPKQECSLISLHKSQAIALRVLANAYQRLLFCVRNLQNNANPAMHLLNPLQAPKLFCSFHSVTPLPHTTIPNHSVKGNQICLRSLLPFRCIPFRAVATFIRSRSLRSIASSFHQPPQLEKQECSAPLPDSANPHHSAIKNFRYFF